MKKIAVSIVPFLVILLILPGYAQSSIQNTLNEIHQQYQQGKISKQEMIRKEFDILKKPQPVPKMKSNEAQEGISPTLLILDIKHNIDLLEPEDQELHWPFFRCYG